MTDRDAVAEHDFETTLALGIALIAAWSAYAILSAVAGAWPAAAVDSVAALTTFAAWWWGRTRRPSMEPLVHLLCAITALSLVALALLSGQSDSQPWLQLLLVPMAAATLLGARGAVTWAIPTAALMGVVRASESVIDIEPMYEPTWTMRALSTVILTSLALGYAMYTRDVARRQLRAATERRQTIAAQAEELSRAYDAIAIARDHAIRALRGKTEFLATLSHELRSPLNGLLGLSSVLLESKLAPQQAELVHTLHQSASSMRKILNDVLDLSRIESGRIDIVDENVDLRELIGEVLDVVAPGAARKNLELAAIVNTDVPPSVRLDPIRFGQVLTNLINNALKFTEAGEIVVEVARHGDKLRLTVRDTGPGIAANERDRLFIPFQQTESGERSREIGSGLGLWISERIIHAMAGRIGVESEPGKGSTFFVEWKMELGEVVPRDSLELRRGIRMLAVEDHEASARALETIAAALGIELTVARSLSDATEIASKTAELHIALLDATLPGATPQAAAEALRALPTVRRIPLVQAIAPTAEQMRIGVQPPFVATTLKPYRASRLLALLNEVLAPRPAMPTPVTLSPWRALSVLVVDDDSTNRLVATLLLERAGLRPRSVSGGEEALALLGRDHFDLVLLDLHMEGIDGLETARRIRAELDVSQRLWIIALTASVYEEDRQRCLDAGMDDIIPKPIEIGLFRAAMERAQRAVRRRSNTQSSTSIPAADGGVDPRMFVKLYQALGSDVGELAVLIDDYVGSSAEHCEQLRTAVADKDTERARRAVHTLASSSGQLGAYRLERLARNMEMALAESATLPDALAVDELEREREGALMRLHERLNELMG